MPIYFDGMEAEGAPLVCHGIHPNRGFGKVPLLDAVSVDDHDQIIELIVPGRHRGLPVRSLLELSVARKHVDAPSHLLHAAGERRSNADRKSVSEWPRVGLDAGRLVAIGMSVEL